MHLLFLYVKIMFLLCDNNWIIFLYSVKKIINLPPSALTDDHYVPLRIGSKKTQIVLMCEANINLTKSSVFLKHSFVYSQLYSFKRFNHNLEVYQ